MEPHSNITSDDRLGITNPGNVSPEGVYVQTNYGVTDKDGDQHTVSARPTRKPTPSVDSPEARAKIRSLWSKAVESAEKLRSSAEGDRSSMFGAAVSLEDALARLWKLKQHRDDNWVGILDQVDTALKTLAENGIETATSDQCWKMVQLVETYLSPATKTIEDLDAAVRLVLEMNLDPYRGLEPLADS